MTPTAYTRALGARLLAEANDIKRTPESLAAEMGLPLEHIAAAVAGDLSPVEYRSLFEAVAQRYPIAFGRLWIEAPDTDTGVLHMTAAESEVSSRVFERPDRTGLLMPYYEYRDTAMSRTAPFRPEWIRMLRAVDDVNPLNPGVAYNKGHFLHQTTFFVGPVNFYWEVDGKRHAIALDTGDSNYITPFWPHSFTTRDPSRPAFIVAVTYGAEVARARDELSRIGADALSDLVLDVRREAAAYAGLLRRHLAHETMTESRFIELCGARGLDAARITNVLCERMVPSAGEVTVMADVLYVSPRDLMPPTRMPDDEVVVLRRAHAETYPYPESPQPCYQITRLARSRHQPCLKSFLIRVLSGPKAPEGAFRVPLHQFMYNYGEAAVRLVAQSSENQTRVATLAPRDSAYVAPMITCRFETDGRESGDMYVVRVPGDLHTEAVFELSGVAPHGISRAANETMRWF